MTEAPGREAETMALDFTRRIREKCPIVDAADSKAFALDIIPRNPPLGFLTRLAEAHQHWDRATFDRDLQAAGKLMRVTIGDRPYSLLVTALDKSDPWIFDQLASSPLEIPTPEKILCGFLEPGYQEPYERVGKINETIPQGSLVLFIDDASISGGMVIDGILSDLPQGVYDTKVIFLRTTELARTNITKHMGVPPMVVGERILTLEESLSEADLKFLKELDGQSTPTAKNDKYLHEGHSLFKIKGLHKGNSLFTMWYKVPDNYPDVLTGGRENNLPPLIRPDNLVPPYK